MYNDDMGVRRRPEAHSIYAAIVPFPITCFILTFVTDLAYWATDSFIWETVSVWLLTAGLIVAGSAILGGLIDLGRSRSERGLGQPWITIIGQTVAFALSLVNVFVHSRDGYTAVVPEGLILSGLVVLVLLVTTVMRHETGRPRVGGLV